MVDGAFTEATERADGLLLGRRTWRARANAWPERAGGPFADRMDALPKYIVSHALDEADPGRHNTRLVHGDKLWTASANSTGPGRDLLVLDSPALVRTLLAEDLADELRPVVVPLLLGGGRPLFPADGALRTLEPASTTSPTT
ncbi:dihydrofolate reductase family protein [Streptomyces bikiniensis]|uniref:dihydrofolate reductase family protein n=1 Tax=Streptomyces bikiniensis TaxID=1896 RepID=UPI00068A0DD8|nr:dihydrofolate reductase family protein [Streptomyces bikiniensis]